MQNCPCVNFDYHSKFFGAGSRSSRRGDDPAKVEAVVQW